MSATFVVTNRAALPQAVDPAVAMVANQVATAAANATPRRTGQLAAGWQVRKDRDGRWVITNAVRYARFVEYGTKRNRPVAMLGKATAQARGRYGV